MPPRGTSAASTPGLSPCRRYRTRSAPRGANAPPTVHRTLPRKEANIVSTPLHPIARGPAVPAVTAHRGRRLLVTVIVAAVAIGLAAPAGAQAPHSRWQAAIDATWGPGLPTARKLEIFDAFWK